MAVVRQHFPFVTRDAELGAASLAPMLPLTLVATRSVAVSGLLDTGATVNVLPYTHGIELGFDWDQQTTSVRQESVAEGRSLRVVCASGSCALSRRDVDPARK